MSAYHFYQAGYKLDVLKMQLKFACLHNKMNKFLNFKCPICMEPMITYADPECGHPVCKDCYKKCVNTVNGKKCCICRQEIKFKK